MNGILQDVRYALRQLRKSPGFTTVAVITLALGIGANTSIYTLLDQALLRSLPVRDPQQLVRLQFTGRDEGHLHDDGGVSGDYFSYPMYRDLRDGSRSSFSGLLATSWGQVGLVWQDRPELVSAEMVSGNYFDVLGVLPAEGRLLVPSDDVTPDASPVAVLSFGYWHRRFASDPRIVNSTVLINGHPFTILGVAPPGFHSVVAGNVSDIYVPMTMKGEITPQWQDLMNRRSRWLNIIARLKPGVNLAQAEAAVNPLWHGLRAEELQQIGSSSPQFRQGFLERSRLMLLDAAKGFSPLRENLRTPLMVLMGMVLLVALMACANVGSLLLVRAASQVREVSVRFALGAKRSRIVQQLFVQGLLLGISGGVLGLLLAPKASEFLMRTMLGPTGDLPFSSRPDLRILSFNFVLAMAVSLLFSLAPAMQFWRPDVVAALKQQVATLGGGPQRFRRTSVCLQIALSVLLLVGAGLFVRTLSNLKSVNAGLASDHLLTFTINPRLAGYDAQQCLPMYKQLIERLSALPGVHYVSATDDPVLADDNSNGNFSIEGYPAKENEEMEAELPDISPGYFSTLGISLLAGRDFSDQDGPDKEKVAIVNESLARRYFGNPALALDRRIVHGDTPKDPNAYLHIVGVVKDTKQDTVRDDFKPALYSPYTQNGNRPFSRVGAMTFYIRTWQAPEAAAPMIRQVVLHFDSKLAVYNLRTMEEQINSTLSTERVIAILAVAFGCLAAMLAAIGLYGVLAYSTTQRTREIGIRIALGADRASVAGMVLREVLWLAGIGIVVALPTAALLTHFVKSEMFGVSVVDPLTFVAVTIVTCGVALAAALIPARRAASVNPITAIRYE